MIVSLRDAEIELARLSTELEKLRKQKVTSQKVIAPTTSGKRFQSNPVAGLIGDTSSNTGTSSISTVSYVPNTIPSLIVKEVIYDTSSTLAGLPTGLGTEDTGQLYYNSYFKRYWFWDGAAWNYNDSGIGAGGQCSTSGPAPSGGLWQACDGSTVSCALDNATIGNKTASPAQATGGNNPSIQGGAGDTTQHAAVAPTWNATARTETTSLSISSGEGSVTVQSGSGATPGDGSVSSSASPNPHSHALTNTNAKINPPTDAAGLGLRISMAWWMRR